LSETAYLERRAQEGAEEGPAAWDIRWFTPGGEVALCGHATLCSAHALWDTGRVSRDRSIAFHTREAGTLKCEAVDDWIRMDFPVAAPVPSNEQDTKVSLSAALGVEPAAVLHLGKGPQVTPDWLLVVTPEAFEQVKPDPSKLSQIRLDRGVIVTCQGAVSATGSRVLQGRPAEGFDFSSRFFAPIIPGLEDPVTGSAHCLLVPFWSARLGKKHLCALQASPRGGILRCHQEGERVIIEGQAVSVISGRMTA